MLETLERFPDAKRDFVAQLGEHHYTELVRAAGTVASAVSALDAPGGDLTGDGI
jgi:hypothetical protein